MLFRSNALDQSEIHKEDFAALCVGIPQDTLDAWTTRIEAWELDRDQRNPYFNPSSGKFGCQRDLFFTNHISGPSELDIRKRLTAEEEKEQLASTAAESWADSASDYTETKYLLFRLDFEEQK